MSPKLPRTFGWMLGTAVLMAVSPWAATAQTIKPPTTQLQGTDLKKASALAYDGAVDATRKWINASRIDDGKVVPPAAIVPAGALQSSSVFADEMRKYMTEKGVPESVARSFTDPVADAFNAWARGYATTAPAAFATLPLVPPGLVSQISCSCTPPHPLRAGISMGEQKMSAPSLAAALKASVKPSPSDAPAIDELAKNIAERFRKWHLTATLGNMKAIAKPAFPGAPTFVWGLKGYGVFGGPGY